MIRINLVVIKTKAPKALMEQYTLLGLNFEHHKHGNGPMHYASEHNGQVFEIYPLPQTVSQADNTIRLGFEVTHLATLLFTLEHSSWIIHTPIQETPWGNRAILKDLDGRTIELTEKEGL